MFLFLALKDPWVGNFSVTGKQGQLTILLPIHISLFFLALFINSMKSRSVTENLVADSNCHSRWLKAHFQSSWNGSHEDVIKIYIYIWVYSQCLHSLISLEWETQKKKIPVFKLQINNLGQYPSVPDSRSSSHQSSAHWEHFSTPAFCHPGKINHTLLPEVWVLETVLFYIKFHFMITLRNFSSFIDLCFRQTHWSILLLPTIYSGISAAFTTIISQSCAILE